MNLTKLDIDDKVWKNRIQSYDTNNPFNKDEGN